MARNDPSVEAKAMTEAAKPLDALEAAKTFLDTWYSFYATMPDGEYKFLGFMRQDAKRLAAALAAHAEAAPAPELNDRDGWVYDPDKKLAEIRASMSDEPAPELRETDTPTTPRQIANELSKFERQALSNYYHQAGSVELALELRVAINRILGHIKFEPESQPQDAREAQSWPVCKWCHTDIERWVKSAGKCPWCGAIDWMEARAALKGASHA